MEIPPAASRGSTNSDVAAASPSLVAFREAVRLPVIVALEFDPVAVTDPVCLAVVPVAPVLRVVSVLREVPAVAVCLGVVPVEADADSSAVSSNAPSHENAVVNPANSATTWEDRILKCVPFRQPLYVLGSPLEFGYLFSGLLLHSGGSRET
jgi:hypothetical protein